MNRSVFFRLVNMCILSVLLTILPDLCLSNPIASPENKHHRASLTRNILDTPLLSQATGLDTPNFLSPFLSTLNVTEKGPQHRSHSTHEETPEYMLELYNRFANDHTAVPAANIVRSFKNEDYSPYSVTGRGESVHPLQFNISIPQHEHITFSKLRLYTTIQGAKRPQAGFDQKVTIYKIHERVLGKKEVETEERRQENREVLEMKDLEELMTKHVHARDNSWMSFDLTHVVQLWHKSECTTHRLEVHVVNEELEAGDTLEVSEVDWKLVDVGNIDRGFEGKHSAVMIVFTDDKSRGHKQEKQEINQIIEHENDLTENLETSQHNFRGHINLNDDHAKSDEQSVRQSNLIYDTPPRIRRNVKTEPCKRTPLFVDFKDIGWDSWVIQPLGYEAYECNGVCNPPMTAEVSPTKHAIVQTLLSIRRPQKASRACCVPTKLEPISLLYHDNGVVTFNYKYEGMVVAECGCR